MSTVSTIVKLCFFLISFLRKQMIGEGRFGKQSIDAVTAFLQLTPKIPIHPHARSPARTARIFWMKDVAQEFAFFEISFLLNRLSNHAASFGSINRPLNQSMPEQTTNTSSTVAAAYPNEYHTDSL